MMNKYRLAGFCFSLVLALSYSTAAATRTVDRLDDSGVSPFPCTAAPNDCDLRSAIRNATHGDTINVSPALYGQTIVMDAAVDIDWDNLIIQGPGADLITVKSLSGFIMRTNFQRTGIQLNGWRFADSWGGLHVFSGESITVNNVVFDNLDWPTGIGGEYHPIYISSGTAAVNGCIFTNNYTGTTASPSGRKGGAIYNAGNLTINGSVFAENAAQNHGGAIYNASTLTVSNSTFHHNTGGVYGGGIFNDSSGAATVFGSTFTTNNALKGSGIDNNGVATVIGSSFIGNFANGSSFDDGGGGIYNRNSGTLRVVNSTFVGNTGMRGAAIHSLNGTAFLRHLTITNNPAAISEGGVAMDSTAYTLANSIITDNSAPAVPNTASTGISNIIGSSAGLRPLGFYGGGTQTRALNCNSPAIGAGNNALSTDHNGTPLGFDQRGAVRPFGTVDIGAVEAGDTYVSNISDNIADTGSLRKAIDDAPSGGMLCFDQAYFSTLRTIAMTGGTYVINKSLVIEAPGSGLLALDANFASRHFTVTGSTLLVLSGMTLTDGDPNISDVENDLGGSIFINGSLSDSSGATLNASDIVVSNTQGAFGGIYNRGILNLTDSTISGSSATGFANEFRKTATVERTSIINNAAVQGAGVENRGTLTIRDSIIRFNVANHPSGSSGSSPIGGGIMNAAPGMLSLQRSLVANNTAQLGGGLYNSGYADLRNSTFTSNSALQTGNGPTADGGAIYGDGNYVGTAMATIDATNCTIAGNAAANFGGGTFLKQIPGSFAVHNFFNSISALNSAPNAPDISGEVYSYGHNLVGNNSGLSWAPGSPSLAGNIIGTPGSPIDPKFTPFGDFGGPTPMLALLPTSPAINAGHPSVNEPTDQRGVTRPVDGRGDIGAFERNITLDQTTLPNEAVNHAYNGGNGVQLSATRHNSLALKAGLRSTEAVAPTQFSLMPVGGQQLPPGITLSPTGLLSGTPTTLGTYNFTVKATDTDGMAGAQVFQIQVLVPTAANAAVFGRVLGPDGRGVSGARVQLVDMQGIARIVITNGFGHYHFDDVRTGATYVLTATSKRFRFDPRIVTIHDTVTDLDIWAVSGP
jgi:hypothetical protein